MNAAAAKTPKPIVSLGDESLRDEDGNPADLSETAYMVSKLSAFGIDRLSVFLQDLASRAPFDGPAWTPHRLIIEALEADLQREKAKRSKP